MNSYAPGSTAQPRRDYLPTGTVHYPDFPHGFAVFGVLASDSRATGTSRETVIRQGTSLARRQSDQKLVPTKRATLAADASAATSLTVTSAEAFVVGDAITVDGNATNITEINGNVVTVDTAVTGVTGDLVLGSDPGVSTPLFILNGTFDVQTARGDAVELDGTGVLVQGVVMEDRIRGDVAALVEAGLGTLIHTDKQLGLV